jgi:hypothetical protein
MFTAAVSRSRERQSQLSLQCYVKAFLIFGKIFHPRNLRPSAGNALVFGCGFAALRLRASAPWRSFQPPV